MDVAGQVLGTAALAALVFALIEGGKGGFGARPALGGIAVALVAFAGFVAVERRAARPLLDLRGSAGRSSPARTRAPG